MSNKRGWLRCSVVGVASLLGVPNVDFPLDDIVDRVFDQLDNNKRNKGRELADHASDALAALKHKHDASTVESACLTATNLLRDFGLSDRDFADLALDTGSAAKAVLGHANFTVDEQVEIKPLCLKILTSFYESVLQEKSLLAELLPHIHAAALRDLGDLKTGQKAIAQQLEELCELVGSDQVESVQRENHLTQAALANMFGILSEQNVPPEQLDAKLRQIAERHLELTERLHALAKSNDEPEVTKRREQAAEALEAGDYDLADQLLAETEAIDRQAIIEQREALDRRQLSAAMTLGQRGDLECIRLNYRKAAGFYAEATGLLPEGEDEVRLAYLEKQASALRAQGQEFGDNDALIEAIDAYQMILDRTSRESMPFEWAHAQVNLGVALRNLGRREGGTKSLMKAVEAFEGALEIRSRKSTPIEWARTQLHLGIAFQRIGEQQLDSEHLKKAARAYRHALKELTRQRMPLEWATVLDNLGTALRSLGERACTTELLKESIDAFELALEERTRERVPLAWAGTMHKLGLALLGLGERENSTEKLEQAVIAYKAAQEERTRERIPLEWASTQRGLGCALRAIGVQKNDLKLLEQSAQLQTNALQELTPERTPIFWAWAQYDLGMTFCAIAQTSKNEAAAKRGYDAVQLALSVFEERQHDFAIETAKKSLANTKTLPND